MTVTQTGSVVLSTLAVLDVLVLAGITMTRGGRLLSCRGSLAITGLTAGDGPFLVGLATKDLSASEIEEFLEISGPVTPSDVLNVEKSSRGSVIRTLGMLIPSGNGTVSGLFLDNRGLSGLRFSEEAAGWQWWILNAGAKALETGSTFVQAVQLFVEFNPSG